MKNKRIKNNQQDNKQVKNKEKKCTNFFYYD